MCQYLQYKPHQKIFQKIQNSKEDFSLMSSIKRGSLCLGCLRVAEKLYASNDFRINNVRDELKRECRKLSFFKRIICNGYINRNDKKIVHELKRHNNPYQVCNSLNLCKV